MPRDWIDACADQAGLAKSRVVPEDPIPDSGMSADVSGVLSLPCKEVDAIAEFRDDCLQQATGKVEYDRRFGFLRAAAYVPDGTQLIKAKDRLLEILCPGTKQAVPALDLTDDYQDAIWRFGILSETLSAITPAYQVFFVVLLVLLLLVQIGTLVGHRRERYAAFLASGMHWYQIYWMLGLQVLMAATVGFAVAVVLHEGAAWWINNDFAGVLEANRQALGLSGQETMNLLPLAWSDYLAAIAVVDMVALAVMALILWWTPILPRSEVAKLLQG
jgi:hypothetical protein